MSSDNFTPIVNADSRKNDKAIWNDPMAELDAAIGNLTTLTTTAKTSAVAALNEIDADMGAAASTLSTTAKNFTEAINETFANELDNWRTHTNVAWITANPAYLATVSVASGTATITIPQGILVTGNQATSGVSLAALGSTAVGNTQALYIDITTPAAPTWSGVVAPTATNIKNYRTRILAVVNINGRLVSPLAGLQSQLDQAARYDPIWNDQINTSLFIANQTTLPTVSIAGTAATITIPACHWVSGAHGGFGSVAALPSTVLTNTQVLYLDVTVPAAPTWSAVADSTDIKANIKHILAVVNWYGRIYSPIPGLAEAFAQATSPVALINNSLATVWVGGNDAPALTMLRVVNTVTVGLGGGFLVTGKIASPGYTAIGILAPVDIAHTQCVYIDVTTPATPTWSAAVAPTDANLKNDPNHILAFVNFYGRLYSPIASLQKLIDAAETETGIQATVVVAASGGDYATITLALAAVAAGALGTDRVRIYVKNGAYAEYGMVVPMNCEIVGESREGVVITGSIGAYDATKDIFLATETATLKNLTLVAHNVKYCVHSDSGSGAYTVTLENCHLKHDTGFMWGIGAHGDQHLVANNCIFEYYGSGVEIAIHYGIYFHNWNEQSAACSLTLTGCNFVNCGQVAGFELGSDCDDHVMLTNCTTNLIEYGVSLDVTNTYYNGGVETKANIPYNIKFLVAGGRVPYLAAVTDRAAGWLHAPGVYDDVVENANGSTLAAGTAVAYDYTSTDYQQRVNIASATRCDGVLLASVTTGAQGWMARKGNCALGLCDTTEVALGDWLKPNASTGQWEPATEAAALAVALGTKAAGSAGLVKVRIL